MNPRPLGYESHGPHPRRLAASVWSNIRADPAVTLSHRIPGRAVCPWCLYYIRYYTRAAISMSQTERPGLPSGVRVVSVRNGTADRSSARPTSPVGCRA